MKKILILLSMLFCFTAYAQTETLNWYIGDDVYATTTCESGNDILLPTTPTKRGYTFKGWASYQLIEYIESTGTQWIDTGIYPNQDIGVKTKMKVLSLKNSKAVFFIGSTDYNISAFECYYWDDKLHFRLNDAQQVDMEKLDLGDLLEIDWNKNIISHSVNGVIQPNITLNSKNFSSLRSLHIMHTNRTVNPHTLETGIIKLYYFKIYDNDILVRDFIPVLDPSGVPCMYDRVEDKFYYNAGTGQFIAGPIVGSGE